MRIGPLGISIQNLLSTQKPYCVYLHFCDGVLFYIGSGFAARAFEIGGSRRNPAYESFRAGRTVEVCIYNLYADRNDARREEYGLIRTFRPTGNLPFAPNEDLEWVVTAAPGGYPWTVATSPEATTVIRCDPIGVIFPTIKAASIAMGVSRQAISNSITGRIPTVRGYSFIRLPRSQMHHV